MGDAEWMYENDLDPLYRKDRDTGEIVEWEGGLNPAYEDDGEKHALYDESDSEDLLDIRIFHTFEDAKAWAKENPGRSIVKAPDGKGYVVKDLDDENVEFEHLTDEDFKEIAQAMQQLTKNLQESSTAALLCREFDLAEQLRTAASIAQNMAQLTYENVEEMGQEMQQLADNLQDAASLVNPLRESELYEGLCDSASMAKDLGALLINAKNSEVVEQKQRCTNRQDDNIELISVMKKNDRDDDGVFTRIQNDLVDYLEEAGEGEDPLRLMASGYVLRASAAALVLQNVIGIDAYKHAFTRFKLLQGTTQNRLNIKSGTQEGIDFQNKAAAQATEVFNSYHPKLTPAVVYSMVSLVERGDIANLGVDVGDEIFLDTMEKMAPTLFPYLDRPSFQEKFSAADNLKEKREGQMMGFFNKRKNEIEKRIKQEGMDKVTRSFANKIVEMLETKEFAYQFVLEEVEAASGGNDTAIDWAKKSGIPPEEYRGAMQNSMPEIDGANGPQQFLLQLSSQLMSTPDLMVEFRTQIVEKVMKYFLIGKFEKTYGREDVFTSPNDPVPELQSQEGVRSYKLKLSGFDSSDFAAELGLVMAAKRNILNGQARITGSFSKQEILDDLANKAVTICFHDPSLGWIANRFSGDLESLKSILNQVDNEVSQKNLKSPGDHGHEMLMKLMSYLF
jgi:hypothetical protein